MEIDCVCVVAVCARLNPLGSADRHLPAGTINIMIPPIWLALFYASSEVVISSTLRAKASSRASDRRSLRTIWLVVNISAACAALSAYQLHGLDVGDGSATLYWIGFAIFVSGLAL